MTNPKWWQLAQDPWSHQHHNLVQILWRAAVLWRQEVGTFLGLGALGVIPTAVGNYVFWKYCWRQVRSIELAPLRSIRTTADMEAYTASLVTQVMDKTASVILLLVWGFLLLSLWKAAVKAATMRTAAQGLLVSSQQQQQQISLLSSLQHGAGRLPSIVAWFGLTALGIMVLVVLLAMLWVATEKTLEGMGGSQGLVMAIASGFGLVGVILSYYIASILVSCLPAIVVERASPWGAMSRAWQLRAGNFWTIIGVLVVMSVVETGVTAATAAIPLDGFVSITINSLVSLFLWPYIRAVVTVLYVKLRIDSEGYTKEMMAKELLEGRKVVKQEQETVPLLANDAENKGGSYKAV